MNEKRRTLAQLAGLPVVASALFPTPAMSRGVETVRGPNVLTFGARGDGKSDDTLFIQRAIDNCPAGGAVSFPGGRTYLASNLKLRPKVRLWSDGAAVLKAIRGGNQAYFVATASYAENVPATADPGCEIDSLVIDASNVKTVALAWRGFYGSVSRCQIFGAIDADLLITTLGVAGASMPPGSMVNNRFIGNVLGSADDHGLKRPMHVVRLVDPSANKATDILFQQNYVSGAVQHAVDFGTAAGLLFQGNHVYGGTTEFRKGFLGFVCTGNYFEDPIIIDDITSGVAAVTLGPGNTMLGDLVAKFGSHGNQIVSTGNHYVDRAGLRHCFNDASKCLVSMADVFDRAGSFGFYNYDATTAQPASSGVVLIGNSYLASERKFWNARFNGARTLAPAPATGVNAGTSS